MANMCCDAAKRYAEIGWSVVPIGKTAEGGWKQPIIPWKEFMTRCATIEEIEAWWKKYPDARVGIVTGEISGIVVVDIDPRHGGDPKTLYLPPTLVAKTGGDGFHYFYTYPKGKVIKNAAGVKPGIDIRGERGCVVVVPSVHASGNSYQWAEEFDLNLITECPEWVLNLETSSKKLTSTDALQGVGEGQRHDAALMVCGSLLAAEKQELWEGKTWQELQQWNQKNAPPLETEQLRKVFDGIKGREALKRSGAVIVANPSSEDRRDQASKAAAAIKTPDTALLLDTETDKPSVVYIRDGKRLFYAIQSREFRAYAYRIACEKLNRRVKPVLVWEALEMLEAEAIDTSEKVASAIRVATLNNEFYYDLGSDVVHVDRNGWRIISDAPVYFRRQSHSLPQVVPVAGAGFVPLFELLNVHDDRMRLLLLCWLVTSFLSDIQHPILLVTGPKGSAKTTFTRLLRLLIDPSKLAQSALPNMEDLSHAASQNWMLVFDNVDVIKPEMSDMLCRLCTGDAVSKRRLYTDDDLIVRSYRRCIALNGINVPAKKTDLADRILWFKLEPIHRGGHKSEMELMASFEKHRPAIFGAVLDLLAGALRVKDQITRDNLHRLADFDLWGRAVARAAGYDENDFIKALRANSESLNEESIKQSPVASAVIELMKRHGEWRGTPTDLLHDLAPLAQGLGFDLRLADWPRSPSALSQRLNEVQLELASTGICYRPSHLTRGKREIILIREEVTEGSSLSENPQDGF